MNDYPSCGGFRVHPESCDKDAECKDNPRIPGNCGMACDRPGICVPKTAPKCDRGGCPEGLYCHSSVRYDFESGETTHGVEKMCL